MKNTFTTLVAIAAVAISAIACSTIGKGLDKVRGKDAGTPTTSSSPSVSTSSNKSLQDKAIDTVVGEDSTGVPECDDAIAFITDQMNDSDDGYIAKSAKQVILNGIKAKIKESLEQNKTDKTKAADACRQMKEQMVKNKAEEDKKKK